MIKERDQKDQGRSRPPSQRSRYSNKTPVRNERRSKSRDGSSSGRSIAKPKRADSIRPAPAQKAQDIGGGGQSRLQLGMFTIFPAFGIILPGGHQTITVDCIAEQPGRCEEDVAIDITDRDPSDNIGGIPYRLLAEACIPSINLTDVGSIFEEHRVCKNLSVWQHSHQVESGGVYGEDENRFVFNNVIVGMKAKARFKISNVNKVPCDVSFTVKPVLSKHAPKTQDVFEVEPARAQVPSHGHVYALVTFCPPSMQGFNAIFEAALEGLPPAQAKGRNLAFEVTGEGNLPRISIQKPTVRNKKGQPLLLFRRSLIGRTDSLPLVITNDGTLDSKVDIDLIDPDGCYMMQPAGDTKAIMSEYNSDGQETLKRPHTASVVVNVGETAMFSVLFKPREAQRSQAHIHLSVVNNQYEDSVIQMVGEGYQDDITLDNIHSIITRIDPEHEQGNMADDDVPVSSPPGSGRSRKSSTPSSVKSAKSSKTPTWEEFCDDWFSAAKSNHIRFGDCHVSEPRNLTFTLTNHSKADCVRFQWPEDPVLKFSPHVGHLHAGCAKDMSVTFQSTVPKTLTEHVVPCKIIKIAFDQPVNQIADWDDRMRTVKWVDVSITPSTTESTTIKPNTPAPLTPSSSRPAKKKVVETEPEPHFTDIPETARTVDLLVSAIADHCKYKCKTESVKFKDTLMFQTRMYEFSVSNKGSVQMDYHWQVYMEDFSGTTRSVTFADGRLSADEELSRPPTSRPMTSRSGPYRPMTAQTHVARPDSAAGSSVISDAPYVPFTIEPEIGTIQPGKKASFTIKFSPLDVQDSEARLICSIPNLEEGKQGPVVHVKARSLMPYCHFELEDSDYISSARRNPELRGPKGAPPGTTLDPNTRVIEFNSIGVGIKNLRKFFIMNPTNQEYSFMWLNEDDPDPKKVPVFNCLTTKGQVRKGKKQEIVFEYLPNALGVMESFWRFVIPEHNISIPFLLAGNANDPTVSLDRSHFNYKALLIGHEAVETVYILNAEDCTFPFSFVESSCFSAGHASQIRVEPTTGNLPPKSRTAIQLYFIPTTDKEVNFNLVCNVKRKTLPLTLNVKAEGYSMNCLLLCEDSAAQKVELSQNGVNEINFGDVEVNEQAIRNLYILNSGKFNFDYSWTVNNPSVHKDIVSLSPPTGGVMFGDKQKCILSFCPPSKTVLRACEAVLKISNGPTYNLAVTGQGVAPGLHFAFVSHNFGPCFIHRAGMPAHSKVLRVSNRDRKDISLDCLYTPTNHLQHDFEAQVIKAGRSVNITFTFYPREARKYLENIPFEINGLSRQNVDILGLGCEMKIEVVNPKQRIVNCGALRVGQISKKVIPIVNNSPAPITFQLAITPASTQLQDKSVLGLVPEKAITLEPKGGTAKVEVTFAPKSRVPQFTEEVMLEWAGLFQPLFAVTGSCQGIEINLDTDGIPFGAVVQKSSSVRKVVMFNTGDIGARFRWDVEKFSPDFSIQPTTGYISPGMEVSFEITFHPKTVSNDIRYDGLRCFIEGSKALKLTLTGMCIGVPPVKEVQHFTTHVRQRENRNLMVMNRTNQHWHLRPIIDGEYFSGPDTFEVDPQQTRPYELTYKPLTMTSEGKKHTGTVFFPLPDGTGLLFNVSGSSEPPKACSKLSKEVPCKTAYTEMLAVNNWLKKPQRFRVKFEMVRPDKLDAGTSVKGLDYIDVPGNTKRDYKLNFYAHKEGQSSIKVVFMNEQTNEFQFYEVTFKASKPGVIAAIDLTTPVRQSVPQTITLENPLHYAVNFQATCSVPEVLMPNQLAVPAQSEGTFNLEYLPLKVGETQGRLEFSCNDLGLYIYDLHLLATPAGPEKALYFRTCLGTSMSQLAKFLNFAKQKTDYACKIDSSEFHVDKTVTAAPGSSAGTEVAIEVNYEPSHLGESRANLTITSNLGGEYTFPLFGTCIPPKPQGPFVVKAGSTASITFRNVFSSTTAFTFQVDSPLFHVTKPGENIRSRKDHRIVVGFDGNDSGSKAAVMGKLIVSCPRSAGGQANVQWIYYLKGITP